MKRYLNLKSLLVVCVVGVAMAASSGSAMAQYGYHPNAFNQGYGAYGHETYASHNMRHNQVYNNHGGYLGGANYAPAVYSGATPLVSGYSTGAYVSRRPIFRGRVYNDSCGW